MLGFRSLAQPAPPAPARPPPPPARPPPPPQGSEVEHLLRLQGTFGDHGGDEGALLDVLGRVKRAVGLGPAAVVTAAVAQCLRLHPGLRSAKPLTAFLSGLASALLPQLALSRGALGGACLAPYRAGALRRNAPPQPPPAPWPHLPLPLCPQTCSCCWRPALRGRPSR